MKNIGGVSGIRTHVRQSLQLISSQHRYDHFGITPQKRYHYDIIKQKKGIFNLFSLQINFAIYSFVKNFEITIIIMYDSYIWNLE